MAAMASLLENPFKMSPSVNLVKFHRQEVRATAIQAAEVEESGNNKPDMERERPPAALMSPKGRGFSSPSFKAPNRLYSAAIFQAGTSCRTRLCPGEVFVTLIPLSGPTPEHVAAAKSQFGLNLSLNSSGTQQQFCLLGAAENSDQNYVDPAPNGGNIPDLNLLPFTDHVLSYLSKHGSSDQELEEYKNIMSSLTEAQLGDLDSIGIWNILMETPIRSDDLGFPQTQEVFPIPQQDEKSANNDADIDCHLTAAANDNETLSDARYYGDRNKGKRKIVENSTADMGDPISYDHLQIKKRRHGRVLRINEPKAPIDEGLTL